MQCNAMHVYPTISPNHHHAPRHRENTQRHNTHTTPWAGPVFPSREPQSEPREQAPSRSQSGLLEFTQRSCWRSFDGQLNHWLSKEAKLGPQEANMVNEHAANWGYVLSHKKETDIDLEWDREKRWKAEEGKMPNTPFRSIGWKGVHACVRAFFFFLFFLSVLNLR